MNKLIKPFLLIFLVAMINHPLIAQVITEGLQAYYPFNGNAIDESDNTFDSISIFQASLAPYSLGNTGSALDFGSSNAFVDLGDVMNEVFSGEMRKDYIG